MAFRSDWTPSAALVAQYVVISDTSPPEIIPVVSPVPSATGWNNTDVLVSFHCNDPGGIQECGPEVLVTTEGAGQQVTGYATDLVGNATTVTVTLNIDKTPPVLTLTDVPPAETDTSTLPIAASVVDGLSGVDRAHCNGVSANVSNGLLTCTLTLTPGKNIVLVDAQDAAGNTALASHVTQYGTPGGISYIFGGPHPAVPGMFDADMENSVLQAANNWLVAGYRGEISRGTEASHNSVIWWQSTSRNNYSYTVLPQSLYVGTAGLNELYVLGRLSFPLDSKFYLLYRNDMYSRFSATPSGNFQVPPAPNFGRRFFTFAALHEFGHFIGLEHPPRSCGSFETVMARELPGIHESPDPQTGQDRFSLIPLPNDIEAMRRYGWLRP